jgi:hypothetical protein
LPTPALVVLEGPSSLNPIKQISLWISLSSHRSLQAILRTQESGDHKEVPSSLTEPPSNPPVSKAIARTREGPSAIKGEISPSNPQILQATVQKREGLSTQRRRMVSMGC